MKQLSKDPFEAYSDQELQESPMDSPTANDDEEIGGGGGGGDGVGTSSTAADDGFADYLNNALTNNNNNNNNNKNDDDDDDYDEDDTTTTNNPVPATTNNNSAIVKSKDDDDEDDEEENLDMELAKLPSSGDPDKLTKMQTILSQFTEEQMSRYESFRRSGFQKANMRRLLTSITGNPKISMPVTIVVSGIAKMFVGDLVETARVVMNERKETGPIRPCHIREAHRRLKLEGKVPKRSVPRLFR